VLLVSLAILSVALTAAGDGATAAQPAPPRDLSSAGLCRRVSRAGCKWPLSRLCRRTCGTAANAAPLAGSPAQSALPASRVLMPASLRPSNSSHISRKLRGATKAPTKAPSKAPAKQILARAGTAIVSNPSPLYTYTAQMHNTYRVRHQKTPAVVYDAALEVTAQAWANKCIWAHSVRAARQGLRRLLGLPQSVGVTFSCAAHDVACVRERGASNTQMLHA